MRSGLVRIGLAVCLFLLGWIAAGSASAVTYRLGSATDLLDAAFYAGQPEDGSDVAGRMAFFGSASGDGTTVAFCAVNVSTQALAIFLVDIGDPSSWRRLTADVWAAPDRSISWTPDDQYLITRGYRIPIATGEWVWYGVFGYEVSQTSVTRAASGNWLITDWNDDILCLPILQNGDADATRTPIVVTNFAATGVKSVWPAIAPDASAITFLNYHEPDPPPDTGDVYVLTNLPAILAAPKVEGTPFSTLAPTSLADANVIAIRTTETGNVRVPSFFSQDKSLVFYAEDWNNKFDVSDFYPTLLQSDFDVMISRADGTGSDVHLVASGNQGMVTPTPGGTRLLYINDAVDGLMHLYITTLEVATEIAGTPEGDNVIRTTAPQQASDMSGTVVSVPANVAITFPSGQPQEIQITTPIDPATQPQLPDNVEAIPVLRELGPSGTTFSPAITVTISYTDAEIAGYDESMLRVYTYNQTTHMFDDEIKTIVARDRVNNTISFTANHFSLFGLAVVLAPETPLHIVPVVALALLWFGMLKVRSLGRRRQT